MPRAHPIITRTSLASADVTTVRFGPEMQRSPRASLVAAAWRCYLDCGCLATSCLAMVGACERCFAISTQSQR